MIYIATRDFYSSAKSLFTEMLGKKVSLIKSLDAVPNDMEFLVFTGGSDIDPKIYGEENKFSHTRPSRDRFEVELLDLVVPEEIPLFGICRGHQLISAYFGGKLHQDLHSVGLSHDGFHVMETDGDHFYVNSLHHQGVYIPPENQRVVGWHKEVSELTIGEEYPYVTTQFHPEFGCSIAVFELIKGLVEEIL